MKKDKRSLGERLAANAFHLAMRQEMDQEKRKRVVNILYSFKDEPDQLDLSTICELEALLGKDLLIIPTKQQWRKIKLQRLNEICDEEI